MKKNFYITTPIYYVNDVPHLGHAYTTIAADVVANYNRMVGNNVYFLTGTDEHGEKIQQAAEKKSMDPQKFTDEVSQKFVNAWDKLKIGYDDFIRTTESRHKKTVLEFVKKSLANGDIYLGDYEGLYCVSDETFFTDTQLVNGKCPNGHEVKKIKEQNYFFTLSKYIEKLKQHIHAHPDFILPESKRNEILSFLNEDIKDLSISRTTFSWGIPFPSGSETDKKHVIYVWYDALTNYISAIYPKHFEKFWGTAKEPRAIHLVGKDILRFHTVYWPCFLMSLDLPLPKSIFAHGWWTIEGQKMSKSIGNVIDPIAFTDQYGQDAFRLFLFREFPMGADGDFSLKNFKDRSNADLANNLGNLVSRTLNLITKNRGATVFDKDIPSTDAQLEEIAFEYRKIKEDFFLNDNSFDKFEFNKILNKIFLTLNLTNKYVEEKAPWHLAKDPAKVEDLALVLNGAAESIRQAAILLWPFIPNSSEEILRRLGQTETLENLKNIRNPREKNINPGSKIMEALTWGKGKKALVDVATPLFMRLQ